MVAFPTGLVSYSKNGFHNTANLLQSNPISNYSSGATSISIVDKGNLSYWPTGNFVLHVEGKDELLYCSARVNQALTVERAYGGTTAKELSYTDVVELVLTSESVKVIMDEIKAVEDWLGKDNDSVTWKRNVTIDGTLTVNSGLTNDSRGPYSVIVYKKTNDIIARDFNGALIASGTNASSVINSGLSTFVSGGRLFISNGLYLIDSTINLNKSSIFVDGESTTSTVLKWNGSNGGLVIGTPYDNTKYTFVNVNNLTIDGNGQQATGLSLSGVFYGNANSVFTTGCKVGFLLDATRPDDLTRWRDTAFVMLNNTVANRCGTGYFLTGSSSGGQSFGPNDSSLVGGEAFKCNIGIEVNLGTNIHLDKIAAEMCTGYGIKINNVNRVDIKNTRCEGNEGAGLYFTSLAVNGLILNPHSLLNSGADIVDDNGSISSNTFLFIPNTIKIDLNGNINLNSTGADINNVKVLKIKNTGAGSNPELSSNSALQTLECKGHYVPSSSDVFDFGTSTRLWRFIAARTLRVYTSGNTTPMLEVTSGGSVNAYTGSSTLGEVARIHTGSNYRFEVGRAGDINLVSGFKITHGNNVTTTYVARGTGTFNGDGSTTVFNIAHGLPSTPGAWSVVPYTTDAKGDFFVSGNTTNLVVTYGVPPLAGTNNVKFVWRAEI